MSWLISLLSCGRVKIFLETQVCPGPFWVGTYDCYMHTHDSLLGLLMEMIREYKQDQHLVG